MNRLFDRASSVPNPFSPWLSWILAGALGLATACGAHGASVEGQVFEVVNPEAPVSQWARVPSADAYVIVHWQGTIPRLGHAESVCLHAAIGKTDAQGRFEVSGSWAAPKGFPVFRATTTANTRHTSLTSASGRAGQPSVNVLIRTHNSKK